MRVCGADPFAVLEAWSTRRPRPRRRGQASAKALSTDRPRPLLARAACWGTWALRRSQAGTMARSMRMQRSPIPLAWTRWTACSVECSLVSEARQLALALPCLPHTVRGLSKKHVWHTVMAEARSVMFRGMVHLSCAIRVH